MFVFFTTKISTLVFDYLIPIRLLLLLPAPTIVIIIVIIFVLILIFGDRTHKVLIINLTIDVFSHSFYSLFWDDLRKRKETLVLRLKRVTLVFPSIVIYVELRLSQNVIVKYFSLYLTKSCVLLIVFYTYQINSYFV